MEQQNEEQLIEEQNGLLNGHVGSSTDVVMPANHVEEEIIILQENTTTTVEVTEIIVDEILLPVENDVVLHKEETQTKGKFYGLIL